MAGRIHFGSDLTLVMLGDVKKGRTFWIVIIKLARLYRLRDYIDSEIIYVARLFI